MSLKLYEESSVKRIAEAIRKKTGASTKYKIGEMASAINEITGGASITVDAALSTTSENPVQNKVITAALNGKASTAVAAQSAAGLMSASDKTKLDGIADGANKIVVDDALSAESENPVQNKAVKAELDKKLDKTGGTVTGSLTLKGAVFSDGGLSFGTGEHIHFTKAADDAAQLKHGSAGVDDMVPFARLKVATPTEDDDAATKAYVDEKTAGEGAVRYDAAQELTYAQKAQARRNMDATGTESPQFKGYVTLTPANGNDGTGVGLSVTGSGGNYVLDISDVNEGNPTLLNGVDTPTDAQTDAAANVAYVKAKIAAIEASGGVDVDDALSATSTNPVQNKAVKAELDKKLDKTGGTVTGSLTLKGAVFSDGGLSFGTGEHIHFTKAADDAAQLKHGSAGVDDMVPFARLKVATPTEDDDAATKAYVDEKTAGEGAVRYDAAQELTYAQKAQARRNMDATGTESPQFKGYVTLTPANGNDGTGVGLSVTGSGGNYVLDISDVNEGNPTLLNGVDTPTDAQTDAAANVAYVKAKIAAIEASGGVDVDDALSATSTNPVQNKAITAALTGKASTAVAAQSVNGLMSAADKAKLDGVATGANKTVVDTALSDTSTNPVQNKAIKAYVDSKASGSGGGKFLITSSMDEEEGDYVIDKTVDEVVAAYEAGQMIYLNNTNDSTFIPLSVMYKFVAKYTFIFDRISYSKSGSTKTATLCRETLTGSTGGTLSTDYMSTDGTLGRFTLT